MGSVESPGSARLIFLSCLSISPISFPSITHLEAYYFIIVFRLRLSGMHPSNQTNMHRNMAVRTWIFLMTMFGIPFVLVFLFLLILALSYNICNHVLGLHFGADLHYL